jgi:iron complex transport system substrate-binding protein
MWLPFSCKWLLIFILCLILNSLLLPLSFAEPPDRIISLAPSITEILFAAGLGDKIVGVTTFCDYPEEARRKPKIGGMSNPSLEAVVLLEPDIVVMTIDGNPREFKQRLSSMKIKTHVFRSRRLSDLPDGIREMGHALDTRESFDALAMNIEKAISRFKKEKILNKEKVIFIIWPEPLIVAGPGTAISDAINLLGGINIADSAKARYPKYSIEEILHQSPDVIFIGKGHKDMKALSKRLLKRLSSVPAVKNKKVFYVGDGLYRLGPRVIEGLEEIRRYLKD